MAQILRITTTKKKLTIIERRINTISGTHEGGLKTAATNKKLHGEDYYQRIGQKGGKGGNTGGFYGQSERARAAGSHGGKVSRRGWKYLGSYDGMMSWQHKESGKVESIPEESWLRKH